MQENSSLSSLSNNKLFIFIVIISLFPYINYAIIEYQIMNIKCFVSGKIENYMHLYEIKKEFFS